MRALYRVCDRYDWQGAVMRLKRRDDTADKVWRRKRAGRILNEHKIWRFSSKRLEACEYRALSGCPAHDRIKYAWVSIAKAEESCRVLWMDHRQHHIHLRQSQKCRNRA
jgi:hypothetical protein